MFGEHAAFIIPSYLISFVSLSVMALYIWRTYRARLAALKALEAKHDEADS